MRIAIPKLLMAGVIFVAGVSVAVSFLILAVPNPQTVHAAPPVSEITVNALTGDCYVETTTTWNSTKFLHKSGWLKLVLEEIHGGKNYIIVRGIGKGTSGKTWDENWSRREPLDPGEYRLSASLLTSKGKGGGNSTSYS